MFSDRDTHELLKEQLAYKVLTGLRRVLERCVPGSPAWGLTYACALDDLGGGCPLPFPASGRAIKEGLRALLASPDFDDLQASKRVVLDDAGDARYASCHVSESCRNTTRAWISRARE